MADEALEIAKKVIDGYEFWPRTKPADDMPELILARAYVALRTPVRITQCFESDGVKVAAHNGCLQFTYFEVDRPSHCPVCGVPVQWGGGE